MLSVIGVRLSAEDNDRIKRLARFFETSPGDVVRNLLVRCWDENKEKVIALERAREGMPTLAKIAAGSGGNAGGGR